MRKNLSNKPSESKSGAPRDVMPTYELVCYFKCLKIIELVFDLT